QRLGPVRNHQIQIEINSVAESLALGAGPVRIIERKQPRLRLLITDVAKLAFKALREPESLRRLLIARCGLKNYFSRFAIGGFNCVHNAGARIGCDRKPIHKQEHRFGEINVQKRLGRGKFENLALLIKAIESSLAQFEKSRLYMLKTGTLSL